MARIAAFHASRRIYTSFHQFLFVCFRLRNAASGNADGIRLYACEYLSVFVMKHGHHPEHCLRIEEVLSREVDDFRHVKHAACLIHIVDAYFRRQHGASFFSVGEGYGHVVIPQVGDILRAEIEDVGIGAFKVVECIAVIVIGLHPFRIMKVVCYEDIAYFKG